MILSGVDYDCRVNEV